MKCVVEVTIANVLEVCSALHLPRMIALVTPVSSTHDGSYLIELQVIITCYYVET